MRTFSMAPLKSSYLPFASHSAMTPSFMPEKEGTGIRGGGSNVIEQFRIQLAVMLPCTAPCRQTDRQIDAHTHVRTHIHMRTRAYTSKHVHARTSRGLLLHKRLEPAPTRRQRRVRKGGKVRPDGGGCELLVDALLLEPLVAGAEVGVEVTHHAP